MVLLVTRYVIKREKKEATKQEKEIQATTFKRIQFQKGKGILKLSSKSRIWSVERKPGDRFMNQDITGTNSFNENGLPNFKYINDWLWNLRCNQAAPLNTFTSVTDVS